MSNKILPKAEGLDKTAERLEEHRSLGLMRRIGRRILGNYPDSSQRETLRKHNLGVDGRVAENVVDALSWTRSLNNTPRAVLGDKWERAERPDGDRIGTVIATMDPESGIHEGVMKLFQDYRKGIVSLSANGIGFSVDKHNKWMSEEDYAASLPNISIVALNDTQVVGSITFTREEIKALNPEHQATLVMASNVVSQHAFQLYRDNKPENIG